MGRGREVIDRYGQTGELSGFLSLPACLRGPVEWVGLTRSVAWSWGSLKAGLLEQLIEETLVPLRQTAVDGVLFSLHGAHAAVDEPDVAGRVLQAIRQAIGPSVPLVATLDLHANITHRMVRNADVLVGYHTFPHIDQVATGKRAARALAHLVRGGAPPKISAWKIPMIVNTDGRTTDRGVHQDLWRRIVAAEKQSDVLSVGLYTVQPWFDEPEAGWTFYQAYLGDHPPFEPKAVARECWDTRFYKGTPFLAPGELVAAACSLSGRPVAVSESHDATNSGAPGDSTLLLAELIRQPIPDGGALTFCVDAPSVARCFAVGEGAKTSLTVGGQADPYSTPLDLDAQVVRLGHIRYQLSGHAGHNLPVDMGRMAVIRSGDATIVLTERTGPGSSPLLYRAAGLEPEAFKIVIAKSPEGFRADYEPFAAGILYCAAPGCATPFLDTVDFTKVDRPVFPADQFDDPDLATWAGAMNQKPGETA